MAWFTVVKDKHIYERAMLLVEQVKVNKGNPLVTCVLQGPSGSGKSALAATIGIDSDFPFVKITSAETMVGLSEGTKCAQIAKGKNLLGIGPSSEIHFLESLGVLDAFSVTYHVPVLGTQDAWVPNMRGF